MAAAFLARIEARAAATLDLCARLLPLLSLVLADAASTLLGTGTEAAAAAAALGRPRGGRRSPRAGESAAGGVMTSPAASAAAAHAEVAREAAQAAAAQAAAACAGLGAGLLSSFGGLVREAASGGRRGIGVDVKGEERYLK